MISEAKFYLEVSLVLSQLTPTLRMGKRQNTSYISLSHVSEGKKNPPCAMTIELLLTLSLPLPFLPTMFYLHK